MIGSTFKTNKDSVLTVAEEIIYDGKSKYTRKYILTCSVCSLDEELWPYGSITCIGNNLGRRTPCGCAKAPKWSNAQYLIRIKRMCESQCLTLVTYPEDITKGVDKISVINKFGNLVWLTVKDLTRGNIPKNNWDNIEDFIGFSYNTRVKSTLTVTGFDKDKMILNCSECSKDVELWPSGSITIGKSHMKIRKVPCGCNHSTRWKDWQYKIRCQRKCLEEGGELLSIPTGNNVTNTDKVKVKNKDGFTFNITIADLLKYGVTSSSKRDVEYIKQCVRYRNSYVEGFKVELSDKHLDGNRKYCNVFCPICAKDKYSKAGISSGWFYDVQSQSLINGLKSCRCATNYVYTRDERLFDIQSAMTDGEDLVELSETHYRSNNKFKWKCKEGHICNTQIFSFLSGVRCGKCSLGGYSKELDGMFYITRWVIKNTGESFLKFGITNKTTEERVKQQNKSNKHTAKPTILHTFKGCGKQVWDVELAAKEYFGNSQNCPRELLPDGFTETVYDTPANLSKLLEFASTLVV